MLEDYLRSIKSFEGFETTAKWDRTQHTNGYGTKALYPGERIDEVEANRRFQVEIAAARQFVERNLQGWDEGTKAALTSLTFNAGTKWASSGLGDAIRNFDVDAVRERFLLYTKSGGSDLPGLVRRRLEEVSWIGNGAGGHTEIARSQTATPVATEIGVGAKVGVLSPAADTRLAARSDPSPGLFDNVADKSEAHITTSDSASPRLLSTQALLAFTIAMSLPPARAENSDRDETKKGPSVQA